MTPSMTPGRRSLPASTRPVSRALRCIVAVALLSSVLAGMSLVAAPHDALAARTWYVATSGSDGAAGTAGAPLRTIGEAVDRAGSGDRVEVRAGVYRESVQVYRKAVHIASTPGQRAILDGSVRVQGWKRGATGWYVDGWTAEFAVDTGAMVPSGYPTAGYPDQVFVDGEALVQVLAGEPLGPGGFFHDTERDRLWIGVDPTGRRIDASNRSWGIYFNDAHGSSLTDVTVRRFATERRHIAAIRAYADDLTLSGVVAEDNAAIGISVIGADVTIRDGRASDNGYIGIHADRSTRLTIDAMSVVGNNRAGFDPFHSAAGIKWTTSTGVVVSNTDASWNHGPGIWSDVWSASVTITGNLTERNLRSGIEIELTDGAVVAGNTSLRNGESGIWALESTDVEIWNNAALGNGWQIKVEEGPRSDVQGVVIRNNLLGADGSNLPLLDVNDWTENRSAVQMGVSSDHNVFWRQGSSVPISRWGRWPAPLATSTSLGAHRSSTGQGSSSLSVRDDEVPVVNRRCLDYRVSASVVAAPVPAHVGVALGFDASDAGVGPPQPTLRLGYDWPADARMATPQLGGSEGASGVRRAVRLGVASVIPTC